jgi:hypothetical protein
MTEADGLFVPEIAIIQMTQQPWWSRETQFCHDRLFP